SNLNVPKPRMKAAGSDWDGSSLKLYRDIRRGNERIGSVYIDADFPEMSVRVKAYITPIIGIMFFALTVAYILASVLRSIISDPILQLVQVESMVSSKKDYSIRVKQQSDDEMGLLISGFNEMLATVEDRDRESTQQKEYVDSIIGNMADCLIVL